MPLWVTDLDGTLLGPDASLSRRTIDAINSLLAEGCPITYSTARSGDKARALLQAVAFQLPAIVLNGALLIDAASGSVLHSAELARDETLEVLALAAGAGIDPFILGREDDRDVFFYRRPANPGQERFLAHRRGDPRLRLQDQLRPAFLTLALSFVAPEQDLRSLEERIVARLGRRVTTKLAEDVYIPEYWNLEVFSVGVGKELMLERLCELLGVRLADVTVIGDHRNDVGMFRVAGTAVAVANAHPEALKAADVCIGSNDADGVALYLTKEWDRWRTFSRT